MRIVHVIRKPLAEKAFAENAVAFGSGGLNITASRISGPPWKWGTQTDIRGGGYGSRRPSDGSVHARNLESNPAGRWPANVMVVHSSSCEHVGSAKVKGHKGYPHGPGGKSHHYSSGKRSEEVRPEPWVGHADADGNETIPVWDCEGACPVLDLDVQSGTSKGGAFQLNADVNRTAISTRAHHARQPNRTSSVCNYGDVGGASRYFKVFQCG